MAALAASIDREFDGDVGLTGLPMNLGVTCFAHNPSDLLLFVEANRNRARMGIELLHAAKRFDVGPHAVQRALGIFHDARAPIKLVTWSAPKTPWPPPPVGKTWLGPAKEVAGGHGRVATNENCPGVADVHRPLARVLDDEAQVLRCVVLDDADGLAHILDQKQDASLFERLGKMFAA